MRELSLALGGSYCPSGPSINRIAPKFLLYAAGMPPGARRATLLVGLLRYLGGQTDARRTDLSVLIGSNTRWIDRAIREATDLRWVIRLDSGELALTSEADDAWERWKAEGRLRRFEPRKDWKKSPTSLDRLVRSALLVLRKRVPSTRDLARFLRVSRSAVRSALRRLKLREEFVEMGSRSGFSPIQPGGKRFRYRVQGRLPLPPGVSEIRRRRAQEAQRSTAIEPIPDNSGPLNDSSSLKRAKHPPRAPDLTQRGGPAASIGDVLGALGLT